MKLQAITAKICILLFLLPAATTIEAQKQKPVKKAAPLKKTVPRAVIIEEESLHIPEVKDFAFVVEIDENAGVAVRVQKTENSEYLADASSSKNLTDFFKTISPTENVNSSPDRVIIVKAAENLNFGKILEVIRALRVSPKQKIKVRISENYYVGISRPLTDDKFPRPNPNYLLVTLQNDSKILLNREEFGTFNDTAPLKKILSQVFKDRDAMGVLRVGTNEVETTVFVAAPDSVKFSDVIKLIREIAAAGAAPIGLQIDDFNIIKVIE